MRCLTLGLSFSLALVWPHDVRADATPPSASSLPVKNVVAAHSVDLAWNVVASHYRKHKVVSHDGRDCLAFIRTDQQAGYRVCKDRFHDLAESMVTDPPAEQHSTDGLGQHTIAAATQAFAFIPVAVIAVIVIVGLATTACSSGEQRTQEPPSPPSTPGVTSTTIPPPTVTTTPTPFLEPIPTEDLSSYTDSQECAPTQRTELILAPNYSIGGQLVHCDGAPQKYQLVEASGALGYELDFHLEEGCVAESFRFGSEGLSVSSLPDDPFDCAALQQAGTAVDLSSMPFAYRIRHSGGELSGNGQLCDSALRPEGDYLHSTGALEDKGTLTCGVDLTRIAAAHGIQDGFSGDLQVTVSLNRGDLAWMAPDVFSFPRAGEPAMALARWGLLVVRCPVKMRPAANTNPNTHPAALSAGIRPL